MLFVDIRRIFVAIFLCISIFGCSQVHNKENAHLPNPRFIKIDSGAIYDTKTDMEWRIGPDRDMEWYEAVIWVFSLRNNENKWRMPLESELTYLYNTIVEDSSGNDLLLHDDYQWLWSGSFPGCNNSFSPAAVMFFGTGGWSRSNPYRSTPNRRVYAVRNNPYNCYEKRQNK